MILTTTGNSATFTITGLRAQNNNDLVLTHPQTINLLDFYDIEDIRGVASVIQAGIDAGDITATDTNGIAITDAEQATSEAVDLSPVAYSGSFNDLIDKPAIANQDGSIIYDCESNQAFRYRWRSSLYSGGTTQNHDIIRLYQDGNQKPFSSNTRFNDANGPVTANFSLIESRTIAALALGPNPVTPTNVTFQLDPSVSLPDTRFELFIDFETNLFASGDLEIGYIRGGASFLREDFLSLGATGAPAKRFLKETFNSNTSWFELDDNDNKTPIAEPDLTVYDTVNIESFIDGIDDIEATRLIDNYIIVKSADDLQNIDSSKLYIIDGKIDMGAQQIIVPAGGFFYRGLDYFVSSLYSSENNYTMFVNDGSNSSGNVRGRNVEHYLTGTNSQIFNLDNQGNFGAIEFIGCNFGRFATNTTILGELSNYRQFRTSDAAFININDGLTFNGAWAGGFLIDETVLLSIGGGISVFKEGTNLVFQDSGRSTLNGLSIASSTIVFDFQPSNFLLDWGFNLDGARFPSVNNAIPNMPTSSTKRYFKSSRGVKNTFPGVRGKLSSEAVTSLDVNVAAKIQGTFTYNDNVHFTTAVSNEITYASSIESDYIVSGSFTIDGGPNDDLILTVRKFDDSAGAYVDLETFERRVSNVVGGLDVAVIPFEVETELNINDRIEMWLTNSSGGSDATVLEGSFIRVRERG